MSSSNRGKKRGPAIQPVQPYASAAFDLADLDFEQPTFIGVFGKMLDRWRVPELISDSDGCAVAFPKINETRDLVRTTEPVLVGVSELARLLGVKPNTIYYWSHVGYIPVAIRTGRVLKFDANAVKSGLAEKAAAKHRDCSFTEEMLHNISVSSSLKSKRTDRTSNKGKKYGSK